VVGDAQELRYGHRVCQMSLGEGVVTLRC
jgi:hypothetical protein